MSDNRTLTREEIDALAKLEAKATPGPWASLRDGNQYVETNYIPTAKLVGASRISGVRRPWNPHALLAFGFRPEEYETVRFVDADADLVAALRNAAPALIQAAREAFIFTGPIEEVMAEAGLTEADTDAAYERLMADVKTLDRVMAERDAAIAEAAAMRRALTSIKALGMGGGPFGLGHAWNIASEALK